jgi:predicted dehydrogenase
MKEGMSGYLGTMTATGGGFNFQVYGSKGFVKLEGMTHVAGAPSEERRFRLFGNCTYKPVKGPAETWQAAQFDVGREALDLFARAAAGGDPFPIPTSEMVHGAAVTEAIVKSAESGRPEKVQPA